MATADALTAAGANLQNIQLLGTGLWDNPRVFASPALQGGLYAAPDPSGFRAFAGRYRTKYGADPVRTATLAYDAVALVAALSKQQGAQRFAPETLANPSGFAGIDGLFRFRADGTNERGLAVMKVATGGGHAGRRLAEEFWGVTELYAARSATTASSTGNPACVTRRRPSASIAMAPSSRRIAMRLGIERAAGQAPHSGAGRCLRRAAVPSAGIRRRVSSLLRRIVGDDAVAVRLDAHQPGFGTLLGRGGVPRCRRCRGGHGRRGRCRHIRAPRQ